MEISLTFLLSLLLSASPHQGYVITHNNDTVYCNVRINKIFQPQYQSKPGERYHTIKTKDFNGYHVYGGGTYIKKQIGKPGKTAFVLQLIKGKLNLYQQDEYFYDEQDGGIYCTTYYISTAGNPLIEFAGNGGYLGKKKQLLYDALAAQPKLAAGLESEKSLYHHHYFDIGCVAWYIQQFNAAN